MQSRSQETHHSPVRWLPFLMLLGSSQIATSKKNIFKKRIPNPSRPSQKKKRHFPWLLSLVDAGACSVRPRFSLVLSSALPDQQDVRLLVVLLHHFAPILDHFGGTFAAGLRWPFQMTVLQFRSPEKLAGKVVWIFFRPSDLTSSSDREPRESRIQAVEAVDIC